MHIVEKKLKKNVQNLYGKTKNCIKEKYLKLILLNSIFEATRGKEYGSDENAVLNLLA